MIRTYPEQLQELAANLGVELKDAFARAGIPTSTYYRSMQGPRHMMFETADKVARAITQLSAT